MPCRAVHARGHAVAAAGQGTLHIVSHFQVSSSEIFVYVFFTAFLFIFFLLIFPGVLII